MATKQTSVLMGYSAGTVLLNTSVTVSGSIIRWTAQWTLVNGANPSKVELSVDGGITYESRDVSGHTFSGSFTARQASGNVTFTWSFFGRDDSDHEFQGDSSIVMMDAYSGATPYESPTCDISVQSGAAFAGGTVSLRCTCTGNVTTGTVKRYYKAAGATSWTSSIIQTGVTSGATVSDSIPSNFNGGKVYWRYDVSDGIESDYAQTSQMNVISNSPPSTPSTLTVPGSLAANATFAISWSASTDPDGNLAGYILDRSVNGGSSWTQVYKGAALTTNDTLIAGTTRVRYRVKAYDTYGAESGYNIAPSSGGDYAVSNNQPPTIPDSISVTPTSLTVGITAVISWGESTDPDDDAFNYVLERSADGLTNYQVIYTGTERTYTDVVGSWSTVTYRVKAVDVHGAASGYRTADTKTVSSNNAPTLAVTYNGNPVADGAELGSFSAVFSLGYTVNDTNVSDTLTVKEIVDGVVKKTVTGAVRAQAYTFNFQTGAEASSSYWNTVLNGEHTVAIEVTDGAVTVRKTISFVKISSGLCVITLPSAIATDQYPAVVALSISGYIPADTLEDADKFIVEVTADGTNWERCDIFRDSSAAVHGRKRGTSGIVNAELYGGHWLFIHKITHPGQVFNFRISVGGVSDEVTHIDSVHWAFSEAASSADVASAVFNGVS